MSPQLAALFAQHKMAILGAGAAGAVLLGLRARKKTTGTPTTGGARVPQPAGTLPAAAVVPDNGGVGFSGSTGSDIYALQDELGQFLQQQAATTGTSSQGAAAAVTPVSSTLFKPNLTGNYVKYNQGTIGEIESDGSVYGISGPELNAQQWQDVWAHGITDLGTSPFAGSGPIYGDRATNLQAVGTAARKATATS